MYSGPKPQNPWTSSPHKTAHSVPGRTDGQRTNKSRNLQKHLKHTQNPLKRVFDHILLHSGRTDAGRTRQKHNDPPTSWTGHKNDEKRKYNTKTLKNKTRSVTVREHLTCQPTFIGIGCNNNKKNSVRIVFSVNRQLSCFIARLKIRRIKFKFVI